MKIDESWYIKPDGIEDRLVAGGVVVRKSEDKIFLLLLKDEYSEDFALPKGGVETGENIENAAKREIKEESGISDLNLIDKIGTTERLTLKKDYWSICHYFLF